MREPARSDSAARSRYLHHLTRSLQCVSASAMWRPGEGRTPDEWLAIMEPRVIVLSRHDAAPLYLRATQTFHYVDHPEYSGERKVTTDEYAYTIGEDEEFRSELLSWHWQPSGHPDPHIHIGIRHADEPRSTKWHIPSGRVAFEHVLLFALDELGAETVVDPANARRVLDDVLDRLRAHASWGFDRPE